MRITLFFLLLVMLGAATPPHVTGQHDLGFHLFPSFTYSLNVYCENATVEIKAMDDNFSAVENVSSFLTYIDYSPMLISTNTSGPDGMISHGLPGNVSYMRGMFVLLIEKNGWRSKEIAFDISPCYMNYTEEEIVQPEPQIINPKPPVIEETYEPEPQDFVQNDTGQLNETAEPKTAAAESTNLAWLPALVALFFIFLIFVKARLTKSQEPLNPGRYYQRRH